MSNGTGNGGNYVPASSSPADYGTISFSNGFNTSVVLGGGSQFTWSTETLVEDGKVKRISPKLYFSYVKSKLNKTQLKKLKSRLRKLQSLVRNAAEHGQTALYEEFTRMLVVAVRESEAAACGYDVYIEKKDIEKFMNKVTESESSVKNPVKFRKLEEFPRPVPDKIGKIIKSVQSKKLFDELHVLYLDYTEEKIKSTKEKIREKDPVLLGKFSYDSNRYFFIADWIDEYCDLTLGKFVDKLKEGDQEYDTKKIEDITPEYLERIKQEMKEREERLKSAGMNNFRDKMAEEDEAAKARAKWREEASKEEGHENLVDPIQKAKKPWYKRFF